MIMEIEFKEHDMTAFKTANVILHAFDWPYALVAQRADEIVVAGYKLSLIHI